MLQSFLTVGQQILTLYLLLVVGFVLGKVKLLDDRASVALSSLVMYVVSPCMMVVAFQRPLEHTALHNFGVVTGVSAVLHVVFIAAAMLLIRDRDRERQNCLRFAAVFSNCGFMGYPLMAALVVGYQLSHANFKAALQGISSWVTLVLRLLVLPLASLGICLALNVSHDLTLVLLIAASAPPAALLSMFAARFGKDTALTSSLVSVQTAISALTMPVLVGLAEVLG